MPFVLSLAATSADADSLRHARWVHGQCTEHGDHDSLPFLSVCLTEGVEYRGGIHHLQREPSTGRQDSSDLLQSLLVLLLRVEETKCIRHHGGARALRSKRQPPHIPTDPTDATAKFGREMSRPVQQAGR